MGGPIERGQLSNFGWELPLSQVKFELKSNIIPIGKIKCGIHVHRALLFKVGFTEDLSHNMRKCTSGHVCLAIVHILLSIWAV